MKILVSPAKSLDFEKVLPVTHTTVPYFEKEATQINELLKKKSPKNLQKLMHISEKLAQLNWERNQQFASFEDQPKKSRAAVFAFNGDVYTGLDAYTMKEDSIGHLQKELRILSGLYGILKPLDAIQAYRLEMGTVLKIGRSKNLYEFWKQKVTQRLNEELTDGEIIVNLASKEYFSVLETKSLKAPLVSPEFKDYKNGKLKIISFFAKKARGMMARYLIDHKSTDLNHIRAFESEGYRYSEEATSSEFNPVFIR